jgi:hypothetical protein
VVTFLPAALYHMEPCVQHEPYDPIPNLHAANAPLEVLEAALDIAEVTGSDAWAHGPLTLLYLDCMHFTMTEWLQAHRDWSVANIWLKEALARRQAAGTIQGYEFLLRDPEMITFLNGDEHSRVER